MPCNSLCCINRIFLYLLYYNIFESPSSKKKKKALQQKAKGLGKVRAPRAGV